MFKQTAEDLFGRYLAELVARCQPGSGPDVPDGAEAGAAAQVDLFS
jgi:hypothetical protein